jgi:hypothetical protein
MHVKKSLIALALMIFSCNLYAQDGRNPTFATVDSLDVYGPWQSSENLTVKKKENITIPISWRHKVEKKFAMTCKYNVEIRNDSDKEIKFYFLAGNGRTNYYAGSVGSIKEKVKLAPGETRQIDYPLPTKSFKAANDAEVCKKCKELEHLFMFGDLEAK